jgi:PhzF family phenazine biosynthesis protein
MYQVDAFTQQLFKGNPAAVLVVEAWPDQALMQSIAFENNLSETAFVKKLDDENYAIRWFSPMDEVAFAVMRPLQVHLYYLEIILRQQRYNSMLKI